MLVGQHRNRIRFVCENCRHICKITSYGGAQLPFISVWEEKQQQGHDPESKLHRFAAKQRSEHARQSQRYLHETS